MSGTIELRDYGVVAVPGKGVWVSEGDVAYHLAGHYSLVDRSDPLAEAYKEATGLSSSDS